MATIWVLTIEQERFIGHCPSTYGSFANEEEAIKAQNEIVHKFPEVTVNIVPINLLEEDQNG